MQARESLSHLARNVLVTTMRGFSASLETTKCSSLTYSVLATMFSRSQFLSASATLILTASKSSWVLTARSSRPAKTWRQPAKTLLWTLGTTMTCIWRNPSTMAPIRSFCTKKCSKAPLLCRETCAFLMSPLTLTSLRTAASANHVS